MKLWNSKPRVDFETGEQLWGFSTANFHHVLEKEKYPQFRYMDWNIVFVSLLTHNQVDMDFDKCPKIKAYKQELINKYVNQ